MKRSVLLAPLFLGVFSPSAFAADVYVKGSLSEEIDASNNYFLLNSPLGYTLRPLSSVNLGVLASTPDTRYLLDSNYSYYKYFGPGAADAGGLTSGTPANATFNVDHIDELTRYNLAASWSRADLATTQLAETGNITAQGSINTYKIEGGFKHELSATDSISWSASATDISYTGSTQTPFTDYTSVVGWTHTLSPTTALTNSLVFDWLIANDPPTNNQRLYWNPMTGVQSQLSPRLLFNGSVGGAFVNAWQSGPSQSTIPSGTTSLFSTGAAKDWMADFRLKYQLDVSNQLSLNATQSILPAATGELVKSDAIGLSLGHDINQFARLTLSTQFSHLNFEGTESDNISASINYTYQLTRYWRTSLSYTYNHRKSDTGPAQSSTVMFALKRDFTLYGQPPPELNPPRPNVIRTPAELILSPVDAVREKDELNATLPAVSRDTTSP